MAEALVVLLILIFWGPWPIFSIWAGLRFRRNPSQAPSGLTALLRVSFAIALTWVMLIVTAYAWFIWANVARGEPVFVVAAHAVALAPAFWVTRYRLQVPFAGRRAIAARLAVFLWLAFWIPALTYFVVAVIYETIV